MLFWLNNWVNALSTLIICSSILVIFNKNKFWKMEPMTPLDKEFFKRKNLIDLVRIIATNYVCDWEVLPFAQKYYRLAKQI